MFVAGVDVGFCPDAHDPVEMVDVDMHEYPEETREDLPAEGGEGTGEGNIRGDGKEILIVYLTFNPIHQQFDVLGSWEGSGLPVVEPICPQVLISRTTGHCGARIDCAELRNCPINQIDAIEEVHDMDSQPVIHILSGWKAYHLPVQDNSGITEIPGQKSGKLPRN